MEFCMAAVLITIKTALFEQISDEDLVNLLISDMVTNLELTAKNDAPYYMDKRLISKLMNNKINIPIVLRKSLAEDVTSVDHLETYFSKVLIPKIIPEKTKALCDALTTKAADYDEIPGDILSEIKCCANERRTARLIALVFRLALTVPNKITQAQSKNKRPVSTTDHRHPIKSVENSEENDIYCLKAIFEAYRSKTGMEKNFCIEDFPQYKRHFQRQKEAYFAAEAVRHASRDAFLDDEDPFEELLEESYDGIIEVWEKQYPDGLDRMEAVLSQAVQISMESNLISRETAWITVRVKKGLCHVLVNEGRIEGWVYDEGI